MSGMTLNMEVMTSLRDAVGKCLAELGKKYDNMLVMTADVDTSSRIQAFKEAFPDRCYNVGIDHDAVPAEVVAEAGDEPPVRAEHLHAAAQPRDEPGNEKDRSRRDSPTGRSAACSSAWPGFSSAVRLSSSSSSGTVSPSSTGCSPGKSRRSSPSCGTPASWRRSIDYRMAVCIYTGLATDTGCFRYSNTTARTHILAAEMMRTGIDSYRINKMMFETKSVARMELERRVMDTLEYHYDHRMVIDHRRHLHRRPRRA